MCNKCKFKWASNVDSLATRTKVLSEISETNGVDRSGNCVAFNTVSHKFLVIKYFDKNTHYFMRFKN